MERNLTILRVHVHTQTHTYIQHTLQKEEKKFTNVGVHGVVKR